MTRHSMSVAGVGVDALTLPQLNALVGEAIEAGAQRVIANHNLHSLWLYERDSRMRDFYAQADHVHIDGMPLVWIGKLRGLPLRREHRVTYADWIYPLMGEAERRRWRVFYLGSKPGVAEAGAGVLRECFPNLQIEVAHGYFDIAPGSAENEAVLQRIAAYCPHVLIVGMGMPRQEHWILHNRQRISANAILPAGACIDYVAGAVSTPPRWMGGVGLEWLYRLGSDPVRLWRRYLVEPMQLLPLLVRDVFRR